MRETLILASSLYNQPKPAWLLEGYVPKQSFSVLYGKPKAGKSLLALHWSLELAHQGLPVLYIAGEGLGGYGARLRAWYQQHGKQPSPEVKLYFARTGIDLTLSAQVSKLIHALKTDLTEQALVEVEHMADDGGREQDTELVEIVKPTALVVIDTLSRSIPGGDENDAETMTKAIQNIDRIRDETGAAALVIHHTTKDSADDDNARERGSSTLRGAADVMLHMSVKSRRLKVTTARDFESGKETGYKITPILESAVIEFTGAGEQPDGSDTEKAVLEAIKEGKTNAVDIAYTANTTREYAYKLLNKLMEKGKIRKSSRGVFETVEVASQEPSS